MKIHPMPADLFPSIELQDSFGTRGFAVTKELNEAFVKERCQHSQRYQLPKRKIYDQSA